MISQQTESVAAQAKSFYGEHLQRNLEAQHRGRYVAVEPTSGEHFLADSFSDAVMAARAAYPDRISFVIRIGYDAALHLGGMTN